MTRKPQSVVDLFLIIAPYSFLPHSPWYSPGRAQKLLQVESILSSLSYSIFRINTSPDSTCDPLSPALDLSRSRYPILRLPQSLWILFSYFVRRPFRYFVPALWIYNTRFSESLFAALIMLFNPSIPLYLQIEDLPRARPKNAGMIGLLDYFCLHLLVRRSNRIFVVSSIVGHSLQLMVRKRIPYLSVLPPLLDSLYYDAVENRSPPFLSPNYTILYAGGYGDDKGVDHLISAFLKLSSNNLLLQLVGSVPDALISSLSSNPRIQIVGHLTKAQLYHSYATADVLVCPHIVNNRSASIFPFKLIEYVASGALPLMTRMPGSDIFNLPEVCFFDSTDELALKLSSASVIWNDNRERLIACANLARDRYSFHAIRASMASDLQLPKRLTGA
jgi:glycosyltransferase involved in cell wall biosynthesis